MRKQMTSMAALAVCALALAAAAPAAQAETQLVAAFEGGPIVQPQVRGGSREAAQQVMAPFANAIHLLVVTDGADELEAGAYWATLSPDGERLLALSQVTQDQQRGLLLLQGETVEAPFGRARVSGQAGQDQQGRIWLAQRIVTSKVDVTFWQQLTPLEIEDGSGGGEEDPDYDDGGYDDYEDDY
jgi:hypothetical protein